MKKLLIAFLLVFSLFSTPAFAERYILKFELKQVRLSLNPLSHVRDKINKIEFELPVDKEFYDSVYVGVGQLHQNFRPLKIK